MAQWTIVKLELARTDEFPSGSPSRSYLIRLPLDGDGLIDEGMRAADPARATVRRFWPKEPDQSGYVIKVKNGWAFSYAVGEDDDENLFHLENHPIRDEKDRLRRANGCRQNFPETGMKQWLLPRLKQAASFQPQQLVPELMA